MQSKFITLGILAHVDAGKTTLSEAILYLTGAIRKAGRVDHKDAFLDTDEIERQRGITVFAKEARFSTGEKQFALLDTPGHTDFSSEMERTLQVLDYAVLVVSGADGVQAHTMTLWKLLAYYGIPAFVFVNKMDQPSAERGKLLKELSEQLGGGVFADFGGARSGDDAGALEERKTRANLDDAAGMTGVCGAADPANRGIDDETVAGRKTRANLDDAGVLDGLGVGGLDGMDRAGRKTRANGLGLRWAFDETNAEEIAAANETLMEEYLTDGSFREESLLTAVAKRELIPVFFGSALKMEGVAEFLGALGNLTVGRAYGEDFGARVYKIGRDKQGNRMTYMRVTGGTLRSKMLLESGEKIEQIRLYNGDSFQAVQSAPAGMVCAVLGPSKTFAGQGLGCESGKAEPLLTPTLTYELILPPGQDPVTALQKLRLLEEEEPSLRVVWNEELAQIHIQVMGELELEILKHQIAKRFDMDVSFGSGGILYKETIASPVIGVGHYEPLRHYAEVQLLLEPLPAGRGLVFDSLVSEDKLARNWQRLVLTHLQERPHKGVLTGSEITDMKISIVAGRAHPKHTEGGDFRQATYRALRQGLRKAESVLLEPVCAFRLRLPQEAVGRALTDLQRMGANPTLEEVGLITGIGPVATLKDYAKEVAAYTKGLGLFSTMPAGYLPCHNQDEIVATCGYSADADLENPTGSVFCEHGAALFVKWDEVDAMAHLEPEVTVRADGSVMLKGERAAEEEPASGSAGSRGSRRSCGSSGEGIKAGNDELEAIFLRTYGKSKRDEALRREHMSRRTQGGSPKNRRKTESTPASASTSASASAARTSPKSAKTAAQKPLYVIDGYNVIFAWEELAELAKLNIDSAREALIDTLENYMGYRNVDIVLVFDGYKLAGNPGTKTSYEKISKDAALLQVVYTREAQTADRFIEKTVYEFGKKRQITVVTSDRPVQMAALGDGAARMSAREFFAEVSGVDSDIRARLRRQTVQRNRPFEALNTENE